ncbi:MAG: type II toxin-antitoxin system HicB family antitoxin [Treponema sp.]|jgi:predicted RNase H-like HicB family nuclease|nr:type II toxin-antitoxin system HicB family antitoxin [Treponema sp.]
MMVYYCTVEKEGDEYIAQFPDMTTIVTCGFSLEEALDMAKEALDGCLESAISHGTSIPAPVCTNGYPITVEENTESRTSLVTEAELV